MTGALPALAITVATMLLLVAVRRLYQGEAAPMACPLCGSRSGEHDKDCPWHANERDDER